MVVNSGCYIKPLFFFLIIDSKSMLRVQIPYDTVSHTDLVHRANRTQKKTVSVSKMFAVSI